MAVPWRPWGEFQIADRSRIGPGQADLLAVVLRLFDEFIEELKLKGPEAWSDGRKPGEE